MKPWVHWLLLFAYSAWEHWLAKTEKVLASSTWGLIFSVLNRLFFKKEKKMSFSKELKLGDSGSLVVSEADGVATLKLSAGVALGGGAAAGVAKAVVSAEVDVEAAQLVQLGLDLLKSKLPEAIQPLISELEAAAVGALKKA